ncbi:MAG: hypothetical protein L3J33_05595 [Rhodobacteraceae bacterium]|nr:hypothetical protein [Paracoccaceae bacterium]
MKKIFATFAALVLATSMSAGTLVYTAPDVTMIEEAAPMGGSGSWLIPLAILALLAFALLQDSGDDVQPNGQNGQL